MTNNNKKFNNNGKKKSTVNKKKSSNVMTMKINFSDDTPDIIKDGIEDILLKTPFTSISIPISTYKNNIDPNETNDKLISTIGYIIDCKKVDNDIQMSFIVYNNVKEAIEKFANPSIELVYNTKPDGSLKTIIKILVVLG
jgi:hypothetical protein